MSDVLLGAGDEVMKSDRAPTSLGSYGLKQTLENKCAMQNWAEYYQ